MMAPMTSNRIGATGAVSAFDRVGVVIADCGPLNSLVPIVQAHILPGLFTTMMITETVRTELAHLIALRPRDVQAWPPLQKE